MTRTYFVFAFLVLRIHSISAQVGLDTARFEVLTLIYTYGPYGHKEVKIETDYSLDPKLKNTLLRVAFESKNLDLFKERIKKEGWEFVETHMESNGGWGVRIATFKKKKE